MSSERGNERRGRQALGWDALIHGTRGHPLHPPLTDAVIGMFTLAAGLSIIGFAVTLFALAAWQQHDGYRHGNVTLGGLILTLAGYVVLAAGGWFGGSVVYLHGMRVVAATGTDAEHAETTGRRGGSG